ncbi:MAG: hypothetical protein AB7R77_12565 [Ilumatobacteraceae bacterium]
MARGRTLERADRFVPAFAGQIPSLGYRLVGLIEKDLGLRLTNEQADRLVEYYRVDPITGKRTYRRAALRRPKGSGKSPEGGFLAWAELVHPTVFSHWSPSGQPIGTRHPDPWIQVAALSEEQTDNVYAWLYAILNDRDETLAAYGVDLGKERVLLYGRPGKIEPVTSRAAAREGQRVTFAVLDQSESWTKSNGGVALAGTLRRNAAKMGGWTLELQNAPEAGDGSVADLTERAAELASTRGLYYDVRHVPEVPDLSDRPALLAALRIAYGETSTEAGGWVDIERLADDIADPDTDPSDARRFFLNQTASKRERAFDLTKFREQADPSCVIAAREWIVVGFDGSRFNDATALVATHIRTGFSWVAGVWERPENAGEDWEVPEDEVNAAVADLFGRWKVWRLYADPPYWETTVAHWASKYGRDKIVEWWTNRPRAIGVACRAAASEIRAGESRHDGHEALVRHIGNARRRSVNARDDDGEHLYTLTKDNGRKIDVAMAYVLSKQARRDAVAAGMAKRHGAGATYTG